MEKVNNDLLKCKLKNAKTKYTFLQTFMTNI